MEQIVVGLADGKIAGKQQYLISYALGSCVGICLYDRKRQIAGMAHIILPSAQEAMNRDNPFKFADEGVRALLHAMEQRGADPAGITAKLAGGAKMFATEGTLWEIGARNVKAARQALLQEGIRIIAEDTGKNYGRTISFFADDGRLEIKTMKEKLRVL